MATREIDVTKMDPTTFGLELMGALAGTVFVYHRGDLPRARKRCSVVRALAAKASDLADKGWTFLTQRRFGKHAGEFEYLAIKREHIEE